MLPRMKQIIYAGLLVTVILLGVLHYATPGHYLLYHDTYRRLAYFPISIGAILYGLPGGMAMAVLACASFIPHLLVFWYQGPEAYYSELSEILFYLAAGGVIGVISSRENRLRESYRQLSEKLAASYQRLHKQTERLVDAEKQLGRAGKLSLLGHVSASLAHEIKNPLAAIKGAAEILADEVPKGHPKHEFTEILRSEILRLHQSVEDVLAFCRGHQAGGNGKKSPVSDLIDKVIRLLERQLGEKSIELTRETNTGAPPFFVEADGMTQVMMNVLLNAVDAVPQNGRIRVAECRDGGDYCIEVADNGPGIDPKKTDEIFHSFVTFKEGGTGLGLSITRKIVQRLGGSVHVADTDLGGAAFLIRLPETGKEVL